MPSKDKLVVDFIVNEKDAFSKADLLKTKLSNVNKQIDEMGRDSKFGFQLTEQFSQAEKRTDRFINKLKSALSGDLQSYIVGGAGAAGVFAALDTLIKKSSELERGNRLIASSATEAGISYQKLADINRSFAKDAGLSKVEASNITARITQLATNSGYQNDIKGLQTKFLDIASARGISNSELDNLIGTILSGQDEGLNRLGLGDPSKLQEAYAAKIGKTVDQLTQMEKTQAAVNAVMDRAGIFMGANSERLSSLSGQADLASARIKDLSTNLAAGVTNTLEFRDALKLTGAALEIVTTSVDSVQARLAKGLSPKEIAREEANKPLAKTLDAYKNAFGVLPATIAYPFDLINDGFEAANRKYFATIREAKDRRLAALNDLIESEKKALEKQKLAALTQSQIQSVDTFYREDKSRVQQFFAAAELKKREFDKFLNSFGDKDNVSLNRLRLDYLAANRNLFQGDEYAERFAQFEERINRTVGDGKTKVMELGKSYESVLDSIFQKLNSDNSFYRFLIDSDKSMTALRENTKGLSKELKGLFEAANESQNAQNLFGLRLENKLKAFGLRDEATNFRNPFDPAKLEKEQKDFVDRFLFNNPNYLFLRGKTSVDAEARADILRRGDFDTPEKRLNEKLSKQVDLIYNGKLSDKEFAMADKQFIALTQGLNPSEVNSKIREAAASAREREATRAENAEREAREQRAEQIKLQREAVKELQRFNRIAEQQGLKGVENVIRIVDQSQNAVNIITPNPQDTANLMNQ